MESLDGGGQYVVAGGVAYNKNLLVKIRERKEQARARDFEGESESRWFPALCVSRAFFQAYDAVPTRVFL